MSADWRDEVGGDRAGPGRLPEQRDLLPVALEAVDVLLEGTQAV